MINVNRSAFDPECPKCHKKTFSLGFCSSCRYTTAFDPFFMEKIVPIDNSSRYRQPSWIELNGHAEFVPEDIFDLREYIKDQTNKYLEKFED